MSADMPLCTDISLSVDVSLSLLSIQLHYKCQLIYVAPTLYDDIFGVVHVNNKNKYYIKQLW